MHHTPLPQGSPETGLPFLISESNPEKQDRSVPLTTDPGHSKTSPCVTGAESSLELPKTRKFGPCFQASI